MPGRPDDNLAQNARGHAQAGRASSWARSRPCVVVGAEPAVHRRGRGSDHAAPGRPPRPTSPLRRRSPRRSRHSRRASACFRRSVPHRPSWTWLRAALHRLDDGAVARPAAGCAAAIDSLVPDVAAASEGCAAPLLGLPPSSWHQRAVASARHSTISTSSRAFSDGLASVARLLYALVAPGLAYIRCVENGDDLRPVLELPVGPQNAPFCSFRCRASERSMCGGWGGCEESSVRRSAIRCGGQRSAMASSAVC